MQGAPAEYREACCGLGLCLHGQHRAPRVEQDPLCGAAHEQLAHGGAVAEADDDPVGPVLVGRGEDLVRRLAAAHGLAERPPQTGGVQLGLEVGDLVVEEEPPVDQGVARGRS